MTIVISPEKDFDKEGYWVNRLFDQGLDFFHIRKYSYSSLDMRRYISTISKDFRDRLVLHSQFNLSNELEISRLHINERSRNKPINYFDDQIILSTSTHTIADFNDLELRWEYSFLSPFFPSISKKNYGRNSSLLRQYGKLSNPEVQMVALGGISEHNIPQMQQEGIKNFALLGAVWIQDNPLHGFKRCQQHILNNI